MKYTDGMIEFQVRVYDRASSLRASKMEDIGMDNPADGDYAIGTASIPLDEIKGVIDYIPRDRVVADVDRDGWECCVVITNTIGDYLCNMPSKELKEKVNTFADDYLKRVEKMVQDNMVAKESLVPTPKKKSIMRRIFRN